jgi:transcriptional regulator with XRE-family HTH domain
MSEFDVLGRIEELCHARSWSYYRLSKESGIPYSTLNTMLHKTYVPTVPSLMKICEGFGITMAQFFTPDDETALLTKEQKDCLTQWSRLDAQGQKLALAYMEGLAARQEESGTGVS